MNAEIFAALAQLEKERGIPQSYMIDKITQALVAAYKKDKEGYTDNVFVEVDGNDMHMYVQKEVVDDVLTPATEISLDAARKISKHAQLGDLVNVDVKTQAFGRIAAQTAKQVVIQGIREAERGMAYESYSSKSQELLTGTVLRIDPEGDVIVTVGTGNDAHNAVLRTSEQIPGETYQVGQKLRVYVLEARQGSRSTSVYVSRTHPNVVRRLFELETPEIADGQVEIRNIAREAGSRSKMAVRAAMEGIDPVGACVGMKGSRIYSIVKELRNENIDVVNYTANPSLMIQRALNPAKISSITIDEEKMTASVYLKPDQVSLAIGKGGLNIRLSKMLTGYDIDVYREVEEEDVALTEFADEIDGWIIDALKNVGCDTAKSVLELPVEEIAARADLELEQAQKVVEILKAEFEE